FLFFVHVSLASRYLRSFPTRRSSDLVLLACGLDLKERLEACAVALRLRKLRLGAGERGFGSRSRHLKGRGIDREHRLPLRDRRRSEEHTSELQSLRHLVCRLLLEKKK